jgi:hypothetical protein
MIFVVGLLPTESRLRNVTSLSRAPKMTMIMKNRQKPQMPDRTDGVLFIENSDPHKRSFFADND